MIELYPAAQTDFSRHGTVLHPMTCTVRHEAGARYDLDMTLPLVPGGEFSLLDYEMFIKAPVPRQYVPPITLGVISFWKVPDDAPATVPLYKSLGYYTRVTYEDWVPARSYMQGQKVTDGAQNYQCSTGHGGITTPPSQNPNLWDPISNYTYISGTVAQQLDPGTSIIKTQDFNQTYMRASTLGGVEGYIEIAKVEQVGGDEPRVIPARTIREQCFRIKYINPETEKGRVTVHAVHESYDLNGMLLGPCNLIGATPQTALAFFEGAMMGAWGGLLATNIDDNPITVDWSYKMAGDVLLNPDSGFLALVNGRLIRDHKDLIILPNEQSSPVFEAVYGVNIRGVSWKGSTENLVTRIYPRAKAADNTDLFLPEMYIESARSAAYPIMELLPVDLRVGETITETDGTEVTLTEQEVFTRMRAAAQARFDVDKCDEPTVELRLDFIRLGDTAEFAQYRDSENISPYDWITVRHGPLGIDVRIQMTGYEWDAILCRYNKATFGDVRYTGGRSVTEWQLQSGSVTRRALNEDLKKLLGV